jgi:hypothetical protein
MSKAIPLHRKPTGPEHKRILGRCLRSLMACGVGAVLLFAGWSLSAARPAKTRLVASACMDEAYAYFEAATQEELGFAGGALDDDLDDAWAELIRCLNDTLRLSAPYEWYASPQEQLRFEILWSRCRYDQTSSTSRL